MERSLKKLKITGRRSRRISISTNVLLEVANLHRNEARLSERVISWNHQIVEDVEHFKLDWALNICYENIRWLPSCIKLDNILSNPWTVPRKSVALSDKCWGQAYRASARAMLLVPGALSRATSASMLEPEAQSHEVTKAYAAAYAAAYVAGWENLRSIPLSGSPPPQHIPIRDRGFF